MVLSTSSWNCAGKLADTYETVDETSRAATVTSSVAVGNIKTLSTYFAKPIEKMLL